MQSSTLLITYAEMQILEEEKQILATENSRIYRQCLESQLKQLA